MNRPVATLLERKVTVIGGRAYRSARERLHRVLEALHIPDVSRAVAVSEFSHLYRALPSTSAIRIKLHYQPPWLELHLEVDNSDRGAADVMVGEPPLNCHAHGVNITATLHRQISSKYYVDCEPDFGLADFLLHQETPEELQATAVETREALNLTQVRLTSVQEDLRIAADIQQRMLVSCDHLRVIHQDLDCHACMIPCLDIGGDFYDVINLDTDHVAVVVGDVSGKGITAALMMATCLTLLRAYSESFRAPSRIMRKINPRLLEGNEEDCLFTTLFLAIINVQKNSLTYCNAGHNPALIRRANGSIEELKVIHGPALGIFPDIPYEQERVFYGPGDRLLLYTDGASEVFDQDGNLYGVERIVKCLETVSDSSGSGDFLSGLLQDVCTFRGPEVSHDDITLLSVARLDGDGSQFISCKFQELANVEGMSALMLGVDSFCQGQGVPPETCGRLLLVLDELLVNVLHYGGDGGERLPAIELILRYLREQMRLVVEIRDDGTPFNPFALAEPDTDASIEDRELGGLGIFLVRSLADVFSYCREPPWNIVLLEINCNPEGKP